MNDCKHKWVDRGEFHPDICCDVCDESMTDDMANEYEKLRSVEYVASIMTYYSMANEWSDENTTVDDIARDFLDRKKNDCI